MASTQTFSRFYSLGTADSKNGDDMIAIGSRSGGTEGQFVLSDLPSTDGSDDPNILGDTPADKMQIVQTVGDQSTTFTNREYVGQLGDSGGVVTRVFSAARGEYVYLLYSNDVYEPGQSITVQQDPYALCFGSGTRILTTRGEVAVEDLQVGDRAVTASGRHRTITWTGHRDLGAERPLPADQSPIRIRAGAFGHG
ncbi:Hint domain-containing protein, partial [Methylobacterium sp. Leaf465]